MHLLTITTVQVTVADHMARPLQDSTWKRQAVLYSSSLRFLHFDPLNAAVSQTLNVLPWKPNCVFFVLLI
jgi:hypothetical protein